MKLLSLEIKLDSNQNAGMRRITTLLATTDRK